MPRSNWAIVLVFAVGGCIAPDRELVFVDWNRLEAKPTRFIVEPLNKPKDLDLNWQLNMPGLSSESATTQSSKTRLDSARNVIVKNFQAAFNQLAKSLLDSYLREIDQIEEDRKAKLEPNRRAEMDQAFGFITNLFRSYARVRGPIAAELAFLAGFPDPDPKSQRSAPENSRFLKERLERTKQVRERLRKLDADFRASAQDFIDTSELNVLNELTQLRIQIEEMRVEADKRATDEAKKMLESDLSLKSIFEDSVGLSLPAEPARTVRVQGSKEWPEPVTLKTPTDRYLIDKMRRELRHDYKIWLAIKGYEEALPAKGVRNATEEFLTWRNQRQPEP